MDTLYRTMIFAITLAGILCGGYILQRAYYNRRDRVQALNLLVMGSINLYTAFVYISFYIADPSRMDVSINPLSTYLRPLNLLYLIVPALIVRRANL